jgi:hypothetical protein
MINFILVSFLKALERNYSLCNPTAFIFFLSLSLLQNMTNFNTNIHLGGDSQYANQIDTSGTGRGK